MYCDKTLRYFNILEILMNGSSFLDSLENFVHKEKTVCLWSYNQMADRNKTGRHLGLQFQRIQALLMCRVCCWAGNCGRRDLFTLWLTKNQRQRVLDFQHRLIFHSIPFYFMWVYILWDDYANIKSTSSPML